jgi:glycosyltransferase involved in cell wall biosynthesis
MMASPLFSVIVPTFGRPRFLEDAIRSVLQQSVDDFECVVVDDASPDPVVTMSDPRVVVVRRERNGGPAAARNTGLQMARGRYIAFLDDDDVYTPDRLALALDGLSRAPVAICWRRGSDGSTGGNRRLEGSVHDTILDQLTPHLGQVAIDRRVTPLFDERFVASQDVEWWLRVAAAVPVTTTPTVGLIYRIHTGPRHYNGVAERIRCGLLLLSLHGDYFSAHPRAAAFRWKRIGLMAHNLGTETVARKAFIRSLRLRPESRTFWHLMRSLHRSGRKRPELPEITKGVLR